MPNGGCLDNCFECQFYRVDKSKELTTEGNIKKEFDYCTIRHLQIAKSCWTYCINSRTGDAVPHGPVYANGLYGDNGYVRIPWNGRYEPRKVISGICRICHQTFEDGIEVNTNDEEVLQFCSNDHYLNWWKETHKNE